MNYWLAPSSNAMNVPNRKLTDCTVRGSETHESCAIQHDAHAAPTGKIPVSGSKAPRFMSEEDSRRSSASSIESTSSFLDETSGYSKSKKLIDYTVRGSEKQESCAVRQNAAPAASTGVNIESKPSNFMSEDSRQSLACASVSSLGSASSALLEETSGNSRSKQHSGTETIDFFLKVPSASRQQVQRRRGSMEELHTLFQTNRSSGNRRNNKKQSTIGALLNPRTRKSSGASTSANTR